MPAVRQSQRNRQLVEPYQAASPPRLTIRQQRRRNARPSRRKTKKEIVNEEVRKVTTSRQVIFYLIYIYFIRNYNLLKISNQKFRWNS